MRFFLRLLYKFHLKRPYKNIDRLRYLKRLEKEKHRDDEWYFSDKDAAQFRESEILICSSFRDVRVMFICDPCYHVERQIIRHGLYGAGILNHMAWFISPDTVLLDIGANIGAYSIPLAKAFPHCRVHAFEPNPLAIRRFRENMSMNRISNVHIHEVGVSDQQGTLEFCAFGIKDLGLSSFVKSARKTDDYSTVPVTTATLDGMSHEFEQRVSVMKIDVQGYEAQVLDGARTLIARDRPYIIFEYEEDNFDDPSSARKAKSFLSQFFSEHGYDVFYATRYDPDMLFKVVWDQPLFGDLIAIPKNS